MSTEIDDGLTPEEREALAEDDGGTTQPIADDGAGADDEQAAAADKAAAEAANAEGASGGDEGAADSASAGAAEPAAEAQQQSSPVLVAQVPADVEAKLTEIANNKSELLDSFDNGDMTAREYQQRLDALAKEERAIERQQDRADLAAQMETQRLQNEWTQTCNTFVESNSVYKDNPRLYKALDQEVRELAAKPETASWSGKRFLEEAHKNLTEAFGLKDTKAKTADKPAAAPMRELPPNLAKVPAADVEDTNGGKFAVLDRMASTDPLGYEGALNKMSEAERNAYLAS
ncbi:hypothetical protein UFOVP275_32 [uncultured Caudovirales phage]|uniref:Scaffolding protein n=1 Tax=uncultured Caudovirales phage TaxID=2100421 RepID=A0A6J5LPI8_9CAUD|nr:hypothetical protein UFOVP275_32 [uncultured Caudovirales phage]